MARYVVVITDANNEYNISSKKDSAPPVAGTEVDEDAQGGDTFQFSYGSRGSIKLKIPPGIFTEDGDIPLLSGESETRTVREGRWTGQIKSRRHGEGDQKQGDITVQDG